MFFGIEAVDKFFFIKFFSDGFLKVIYSFAKDPVQFLWLNDSFPEL